MDACDGVVRASAEQTLEQRNKDQTDRCNAAARHELFYPQLGVKLCSMAGGGVSKKYMKFSEVPRRGQVIP